MPGDRATGREHLPIPDRSQVGLNPYDATDPDRAVGSVDSLRPPAGAPNVLIVLLDDVGFGAPRAFGGPVDTPTAQRLAAGGLTYTRFHTAAQSAPTRQGLLTGRNHHSVGIGGANGAAGSTSGGATARPASAVPLAETLKLNGYHTAQFGKCHEVPSWEAGPMGPFRHWPTGSGFEHFYGFVGSETDQYAPALFQGTEPVEPGRSAELGYDLTEDITDQAIDWIGQQRARHGNKPFFVYFAPGATHAPYHGPVEWADKYRGRFDHGWDAVREETLARQVELGVVPPGAELTTRPPGIPAWGAVDPVRRPVLARQMEVYAGFLDHTDHHVGRLIDAVDELGVLDETLVYYILGDSGACTNGTVNGTFDESAAANSRAVPDTAEVLAAGIDPLGAPSAYDRYSVGWAHAMGTPYRWTKQVGAHWGGTRSGTIVHWPGGMEARGELRHQFHHVIDVAPTVLEAAGLPEPTYVNGVQQKRYEGVAMGYTFDDAGAGDRHETQYFELFVNRGVYHKGWTALTRHTTAWEFGAQLPGLDSDRWELYGPDDWTQANDLAGSEPERLRNFQRLFLIEAVKFNVLPLDDHRVEHLGPDRAGRAKPVRSASQLLVTGMGSRPEGAVLVTKHRSHSVTVRIVTRDADAHGVLVAQGGAFGGWVLFLNHGRPSYCYNLLGLRRFKVESATPLPPGEYQVRMELRHDTGGVARGASVSLYVDGEAVAKGRVDVTQPVIVSGDETTEVGIDSTTHVSDDYDATDNAFTGDVRWVKIDLDEGDYSLDHIVAPEERLRTAIARD